MTDLEKFVNQPGRDKLVKDVRKKINDLNVLSKYWQEMQSEKRFNIRESFCFIKTHSALANILGNEFTNKKFKEWNYASFFWFKSKTL